MGRGGATRCAPENRDAPARDASRLSLHSARKHPHTALGQLELLFRHGAMGRYMYMYMFMYSTLADWPAQLTPYWGCGLCRIRDRTLYRTASYFTRLHLQYAVCRIVRFAAHTLPSPHKNQKYEKSLCGDERLRLVHTGESGLECVDSTGVAGEREQSQSTRRDGDRCIGDRSVLCGPGRGETPQGEAKPQSKTK